MSLCNQQSERHLHDIFYGVTLNLQDILRYGTPLTSQRSTVPTLTPMSHNDF